MALQVSHFGVLSLIVCFVGVALVNKVAVPSASFSMFPVYAKASWNTLRSSFVSEKDGINEGSRQSIANRQALNITAAKIAVNLASIAYCPDFEELQQWKCPRCRFVPDFVLEKPIFICSWDVHSYLGYYPPWKAKVIVFRGTDSHGMENWVENLRATQRHVRMNVTGLEDCRVHDGFSRIWNIAFKSRVFNALDTLLNKYGEDGPLYVIGHSLGGAIAQLAAVNIKLSQQVENIYLYTFGAPRVGNKAFAHKVDEMMTESWRFTHERDIVPTLPWKSMDFWHCGQEVFQTDRKTNTKEVIPHYKTCDGSGEDPHGHNSMCRFGFGCDSVSDHLHYMNVPM